MKDSELREMFASLKAAFDQGARDAEDAKSKLRNDTLKAWNEGVQKGMTDRLTRIQELCEAGRRFEAINLPSPRVPLFVGMLLGALIFACGMFAGTFLK